MTKPLRVWYLKGGHAVDELKQLHPRLGQLPIGGPDQYLLAVMHLTGSHTLTVTTLGTDTSVHNIGRTTARTYAARPALGGKWAKLVAFLRSASHYLRDLVRFKPTRVFCGIEGPIALLSWLGAKLTNAEFSYFSHCALDLPSTSRLYRFANGFILRHADRIICNGPYLAAEAARLGAPADKVIEFNVGLDARDEQLLAERPRASLANDVPTIVYAGRIEADKGVFDLLAAFGTVREKHPCKLVYLGNGSAMDALTQQATLSTHSADVQILGHRPLDEVFRALQNAALVVTPTQSRFPEGRCKTVLEAFFAGTPVVAPDFGPFPYAVKSEYNGLLYRSDDVGAMSAAILRLIEDGALRERLAAGARATGDDMKTPVVTFRSALHTANAR